MNLRLFINILDKDKNLIDKVDFFCLNNSVCCDEKELMRKVGQSINILKNDLISMDIMIDAKLENPRVTLVKLKKRIKYQTSIYREKLTKRETDVVSLIMQGLTNKEISEALFISFETVRSHRKAILKKTGAKNTAVLINYYNQPFLDQ